MVAPQAISRNAPRFEGPILGEHNFLEPRLGELLRISLPRTPVNKTLSENRQIEQYMGTGQLNQGQPVLRFLGPASAQAATLDEPGDRPLHHPSPRRMRLAMRGLPLRGLPLL